MNLQISEDQLVTKTLTALLEGSKLDIKYSKNFDFPSKDNRVGKNKLINKKYITLIQIFFLIRHQCLQGSLGRNTKGEVKQLKSIEKWEKVFFLRFYNSRPEFFSFSKASELAGIKLEEIHAIRSNRKPKVSNPPANVQVDNPEFEGIRFDIEDFFSLIEEETKQKWDEEIAVLNTNSKYSVEQEANSFYLNKILFSSPYYAMRRLCTYESERKENQKEYAPLTKEGEILPEWYLQFRNHQYISLLRREQLVAFFNNYDERYNSLPSDTSFELEEPSEEQIYLHLPFKVRDLFKPAIETSKRVVTEVEDTGMPF